MTTLTRRDRPDALLSRLKERAKCHRRGRNSATIATFELADAGATLRRWEEILKPHRCRPSRQRVIQAPQPNWPGTSEPPAGSVKRLLQPSPLRHTTSGVPQRQFMDTPANTSPPPGGTTPRRPAVPA